MSATAVKPAVTTEAPDAGLLADVDDRCLRVDRLLLQLADCLDRALITAAPHPDRELRNDLRVARIVTDELHQEIGELGLDLVEVRDAINPASSS